MQIRKNDAGKAVLIGGILWLLLFASDASADPAPALAKGGTVYVSIYSNLYAGPKALTFNLAAMLSIRNTDPKFSITLLRADYYNSDGELIEKYIRESMDIKPLASKHFYIQESDTRGGPGAKFIVQWRSQEMVNKPIIEGVMTGLRSGQGVSFRCLGREISEHNK